MLLVVFLSLIVAVCSQVATPERQVGFHFRRGYSSARVKVEVFLDLVCTDSRAAWPNIKNMANHYGPQKVDLVVNLFPLPYHQNSFYASRAAFVIHYLTNGTKTFQWIDLILLEKLPQLSDTSFHNNSDVELLNLFAEWVTDMGINATAFIEQTDRNNRNQFERYTRVMWKTAASRGVAGTPTFFVNGIDHPNIQSSWILSDWKAFLDPLLTEQLFDPIDDYDNNYPFTQTPCSDKNNSGSTTQITALTVLLMMLAGFTYNL